MKALNGLAIFGIFLCLQIWPSNYVFGAGKKIPERRDFPLSKKISPCDNFHGYVCNEVESSFNLPSDRSSWTFAFRDSAERILDEKEIYLVDLTKMKKLPSKRSEELRDYYVACMDVEANRNSEMSYVVKTLKTTLATKSRKAFLKLLSDGLWNTELSSLLYFNRIKNQDDPRQYDLMILGTWRTLPERSYYKDKNIVKDYRAVLRGFFNELGFRDSAARAEHVINFETEFVNNFPLPATMRQLYAERSKLDKKKAVKSYPNLSLNVIFDGIPANTKIRDLTPDNFAFLNSALAKKDLNALKSVYLWHALSDIMDDRYPRFFKSWFAFSHKHLGGPQERPDRGERCTRSVMHSFSRELDAELLPQMFKNFPRKKFVALAEKVRGEIRKSIDTSNWLSKSGRKEARAKVDGAMLQLVAPQNAEEWNFLPPANYSPSKPLQNRFTLLAARQKKMLVELKTGASKVAWGMGPLTVNAYYSPPDNKFVMPVGILQYPFYEPSAPDHVNFGSVGAVIGHELGHGIDDQGSRYDSTGKVRQWMSKGDLSEFRKRTTKLIKQFEKAGHNGQLTLGENIGDLVGLTFAYRAAFPNGKGTTKAKQEFFIQYARVWCGKRLPKDEQRQLKTNPHALGYARINQQMPHQPGFAEAFGCKETDPMVFGDQDRVEIW